MPEYLSPGVYMEEIEIGSKPIEGVSTSTAGFLGETERGPTVPQLVTSWLQYQRIFGSYFGSNKYLPYAVKGFFDNGGQRCYIGRIAKISASSASFNLPGKDASALKFEALGEGSWGNRVAVKVSPGSEDEYRISVFYWKKKPSAIYDPELDHKTIPRPDVVEVYDSLLKSESSSEYFEKKVNNISNLIKITKESGSIPLVKGNILNVVHSENSSVITLDDSASAISDKYINMWMQITDQQDKNQFCKITAYNDTEKKATVEPKLDNTTVKNYLIYWYGFLENGIDFDSNNSNNALVLADYERTDKTNPGERRGLLAFTEFDEISIVYSPNSDINLAKSLITHCENMKDRFAIIDSQEGSKISDLTPRDTITDTKYGAFYYPWIKVIDPETGILRLVPPGGHIAGIYARNDTERGVYKAPANEIIRGAADLEFKITKGEQDILNPRGVNALRAFPGRGIRVWGARTLSSDPLWKYINIRRLFLFLEESIEEGTQWVVFEPNNEKLWARVIATLTEFLTRVWRNGALMGNKAEEAFFVKCDRTTMTQNDIDNGRLIVIIGVAPVKPAEFVIFRIAQWASGSKLTD